MFIGNGFFIYSYVLYKKDRIIAGIDRRKEYLKASSSFTPIRRDDINVKPLLEIPGKIAMP